MVFDRIHFAKENVVEIIQLTEDNFLVIASSLYKFKEFQPKHSLCKRNFQVDQPELQQRHSLHSNSITVVANLQPQKEYRNGLPSSY